MIVVNSVLNLNLQKSFKCIQQNLASQFSNVVFFLNIAAFTFRIRASIFNFRLFDKIMKSN